MHTIYPLQLSIDISLVTQNVFFISTCTNIWKVQSYMKNIYIWYFFLWLLFVLGLRFYCKHFSVSCSIVWYNITNILPYHHNLISKISVTDCISFLLMLDSFFSIFLINIVSLCIIFAFQIILSWLLNWVNKW